MLIKCCFDDCAKVFRWAFEEQRSGWHRVRLDAVAREPHEQVAPEREGLKLPSGSSQAKLARTNGRDEARRSTRRWRRTRGIRARGRSLGHGLGFSFATEEEHDEHDDEGAHSAISRDRRALVNPFPAPAL